MKRLVKPFKRWVGNSYFHSDSVDPKENELAII